MKIINGKEFSVVNISAIKDTKTFYINGNNEPVIVIKGDTISPVRFTVKFFNKFLSSIPITKQWISRADITEIFFKLYNEDRDKEKDIDYETAKRYIRSIHIILRDAPELGITVSRKGLHEQTRYKKDQRFEPITNKENVFGKIVYWKKLNHVYLEVPQKTVNDF